MNRTNRSLLNPLSMIQNLWANRTLIQQFTKREVIGRYKGSYLGIFWSFLTPLLMLCVYTFVFSMVFKAKWSAGGDSKIEFALLIFSGLVTFTIFSELISRAPGLIVGNVNYVKKVVFPLEILPVVVLGSSLIHSCISFGILISGLFLFLGVFHWTLILVPLVMLPLVLFSLGLGWFFASLGVFLRDISQIVGIAVQALMLMSPIFYPISALPEKIRFIYYINPISYVVEDMRGILIWGQLPNWPWLIVGTVIGALVAIGGYAWFQKTRGGFADVL